MPVYNNNHNIFMEQEDETKELGLCCCEYINKDNNQSHLLLCCCNCEDFDLVFTRLISCQRIRRNQCLEMLLTFQDRLRIPWRGGAKQISLATLIPIFILPIIIAIAGINYYTAVSMFFICSCSIGYYYYYVQHKTRHTRTRFFFIWLCCSIVYMIILFETFVPLFEILPEENRILMLFSITAIFCLYRTKKLAKNNHVGKSSVSEIDLPDITEVTSADEKEAEAHTALLIDHNEINRIGDGNESLPNMCTVCKKYMPPRTVHCNVCGVCVVRQDHHSYWLDCCIGDKNLKYYLVGLILAEIAILLGSNLVFTSICHPFLVTRIWGVPLMLPDDCSEVFDSHRFGISFVIGVYCLLIASYILVVMSKQFYYIVRGITKYNTPNASNKNRKSWLTNWNNFMT